MAPLSPRHTRKLTIIAQDPDIKVRMRKDWQPKILRAHVEIPYEPLSPGPRGYRVQVIDYDASTDIMYKPFEQSFDTLPDDTCPDPLGAASDAQILADPRLHALNVYAIIMRTLTRFEYALGRRISWGFFEHQIQVAPHAFADANAFYSKRDKALMFGYFLGRDGKPVFSCLSHDVVAHETTHALVDGLREHFTDPSSPEQAAFHEGFADVVALLSVFSLPNVVDALLDITSPGSRRIASGKLRPSELKRSVLFGLAEQMGAEMSNVRGSALRRSVELKPSPKHIEQPEFLAPHRRGELLVAAMLNAFLDVWWDRLTSLGAKTQEFLDRRRVVEEGAEIADYLLTMAIRALDYTPPVHLEFCDFLSAILTADAEIRPTEGKYEFRGCLLKNFADYGMKPAAKGNGGVWESPKQQLTYARTHFESMQRDPDEVFRFIWENRKALKFNDEAYSRVLSVRPCQRVGPDGFALRETVVEFIQRIKLKASQLGTLKIHAPKGMPPSQEVVLYGGATLIFDEHGHLKFDIHNRVDNASRQSRRLRYLWEYGFFDTRGAKPHRFSQMHRQRVLNQTEQRSEEW
ncbi:MAG: hypothetical protein WCF57_19165 [Pyrinomonadaceae bacterium]